MLEAYTTLGFLAAASERVELGAMVSCVTHRNIGLLGKIVATLDVLSARAGPLWARDRLVRAGAPGRTATDSRRWPSATSCSPTPSTCSRCCGAQGHRRSKACTCRRPRRSATRAAVRDRIPILVGGSGERRTLAIAAARADGCNLFGEPPVVAHKVDVLHRHCEACRPVTQQRWRSLSSARSSPPPTPGRCGPRVAELASSSSPRERHRAHGSRPGRGARRAVRLPRRGGGVDTVIVSLADVGHPGAVLDFAPVIDELGA